MSEATKDAPILLSELHDRLLLLTLNRPERLNALTPELHEALNEAIGVAADDPRVRAIALTGAGRAFCSGGDLGGGPRERLSHEQRIDRAMKHAEANRLLHEMPKPTIALVNGAAAGAGLALALACDMRIAGDDLMMTTAFARIGLSGDHGATWFLNALVGPSRAAELMFLSEKIDAAQALAWGLVNRVVPAADLMTEGLAVAQRLSAGPPIALHHMKRNLRAAAGSTLRESLEREAESMIRCSRTEDVKEALAARREKRVPVFSGQ